MRNYPINDLNKCSVRFCNGATVTIIQRKIGDEKIMYGYCEFHSVISATRFPEKADRKRIPFVRMA